MADISKIKVAGQSYDIKDKLGRNTGYIQKYMQWDGNFEGMEVVMAGNQPYYRYSDAIELEKGQMIGAFLKNFEKVSNVDDSELEMFTLMLSMFELFGVSFSPLSCLSFTGNNNVDSNWNQFVTMLLQEGGLPDNLIEEIKEAVDEGLIFGFGFFGEMCPFVNAPKDFTFSTELSYALFQAETPITFPEGFWLWNIDVGEEFDYRTLPIYPDRLLILSPELSKFIDDGIGLLLDGTMLSASNSVSFNSGHIRLRSQGGSYSDTAYFDVDQKIYIQPVDNVTLATVEVVANDGTGTMVEVYSDNGYYFYMPAYPVIINTTIA